MNLYDQHLHSKHSFDSDAQPADNARKAIEVGLAGLTFTEHYDTHPEEIAECVYDDIAYSATIDALRDEFGTRLRIGKGIEVCYQPDNMPRIIDFLDDLRFDLVLLSVHWFYGQPIHAGYVWKGRDPSKVTRRYLEAVLDAVRFCERLYRDQPRVFDVLGHLDFVKRYSQRYAGGVFVAQHSDVMDEILRTCLAADLIPEINTSTLRRDSLDETMPGPAVVQRYADLGGTMMSIGSDSHSSRDIGADLDHAVNMLRDAGINQLAVFENRSRHPERIDEQ